MFSLVYWQMDLHIIPLNHLLFCTYSYNEYVATSYLKKKLIITILSIQRLVNE